MRTEIAGTSDIQFSTHLAIYGSASGVAVLAPQHIRHGLGDFEEHVARHAQRIAEARSVPGYVGRHSDPVRRGRIVGLAGAYAFPGSPSGRIS